MKDYSFERFVQEMHFICLMLILHTISVYQSHYFARKEFSEMKILEIEKKRVNDFLSNLVPNFVKYFLVQGIVSLSQPKEAISVLFCEICNFDEIIANQNTDIVSILDSIYRIFDEFCLQYGVQKIEVDIFFLHFN